jgi:hypothetical protein
MNLKIFLPFLFFASLGIAELFYFSTNGLGNDFPVFYQAGKLALNFGNPWEAVNDPVHSAYINGPMTALIISPLALLPQDIALAMTRGLSIVLVPVINYQLFKIFYPRVVFNFRNVSLWLFSSLALLTFPTRANLEYGQFFFLFATLAVLALRLSRSNSLRNLLLSGSLIGICCDYKPQAFIVMALMLCFSNKFVFLGGVFSFLSGALVSTVLTRDIPYKVWVEVVFNRFQGGVTGDQMHIYAVLPKLLAVLIAIIVLIVFLILVFQRNTYFDTPEVKLFTIFVSILLIPWMHPSDLVLLSAFIFVINVATSMQKYVFLVGVGSLLVWSSNPLVSILVTFLALFILKFYLKGSQLFTFNSFFIVTIPSFIFAITANNHPNFIESSRQYWGLVAVFSACVLSAISVFELPKKDLSTKT